MLNQNYIVLGSQTVYHYLLSFVIFREAFANDLQFNAEDAS